MYFIFIPAVILKDHTYSLLKVSRPRKAPGCTTLIKLFLRSLEEEESRTERKGERKRETFQVSAQPSAGPNPHRVTQFKILKVQLNDML